MMRCVHHSFMRLLKQPPRCGGGVPFEQRDRRARVLSGGLTFFVEKIETSEREVNTRSPDQILIAIVDASPCAWSKFIYPSSQLMLSEAHRHSWSEWFSTITGQCLWRVCCPSVV